jgi:transcriptional regulator with XRE-family HTH domain
MSYPIYVKSLIELVKGLGVEQKDIAKRLKVPGSSVSLWATGARSIPRRHLQKFLALVEGLIREYEPTRLEQIHAAVQLWQVELFVSIGALATHVRNNFEVLESPYAHQDIMKLSRDERRRLRRACQQLEGCLNALDQFERGEIEESQRRISRTTPPSWWFAQLRSWYHMDEAEEEELDG